MGQVYGRTGKNNDQGGAKAKEVRVMIKGGAKAKVVVVMMRAGLKLKR